MAWKLAVAGGGDHRGYSYLMRLRISNNASHHTHHMSHNEARYKGRTERGDRTISEATRLQTPVVPTGSYNTSHVTTRGQKARLPVPVHDTPHLDLIHVFLTLQNFLPRP